jgi:hypothetical protein
MSENAISAQGTLIARQPLGSGPFTTIGELRDITGPALMRNPIEVTAHNDVEEHFVVGIRRKGELTFQIGFLPTLASHDSQTGLIQAWQDGSRDVYRVTYPDGSMWLFSGYVTNIGASAPVDDGLVADVTIRPTNTMTIIEA